MEDKITYNRAQKRLIERVAKEAEQKHQILSDKFLNAFIESNDPDGDEIKLVYKSISAKWKMYCKIKNFKPEFWDAVDKSMDRVIKEYQEEKTT